MKLDVTICHSILKQFFVVNNINGNNSDLDLAREIRKNRIVLNDDLTTCYEKEFEKEESSHLLDIFQQWIAVETAKPIDETLICVNDIHSTAIDTLITDDYLQIFVNITYTTYDKIIFSNLLSPYQSQLETLGLIPMDKNKILDRTDMNFYYNAYHFHYNRQIQTGESNSDLSNWFSRILKDENEIVIIDAYLFQNINKLKTNILPRIEHGANLTFYTYLGYIGSGSSKRQLDHSDFQTEFAKSVYSPYNIINVFAVNNKRDIHDRGLLTNKYYIWIGKSLGVFGDSGTTEETHIHADYKLSWNGAFPSPVNTII